MEVTVDFNQLNTGQVIELIKESLSGNNEQIKHATKILKGYTKHKSSIGTITSVLMNSNDVSHRQMATVLLRRNLVPLYGNLSPQEQKQFRDVLLGQYVKEVQLPIQKGIATLIGILLPLVGIDHWLDLQNLLEQAIKSAPESAATFVLLSNLLYHFKPPKEIFSYILNALKYQKLVDEGMKCVVAVVQNQDVTSDFAVQLIKIWEQSNWGEEVSLIAMEVLSIMVERKIKLNDQIIIWVCDKIVSNKKLSNRFRTAGCDFLDSLIEYNPKSVANKEQLLKKVVETVCLTCSEPYKHHQEEQETGQFVQEVALWLIQTLSNSLKPKKIYPVLFEAAVSLINSNDTDKMNTGFLILGLISSGCAEKIKKNLQNPIMNVLIPKGLAHPAPQVRGAAINCLCYFSEYLIPDIFTYHAVIIPSLMNYIGDLSPKVVGKALIAIDVFFEGMEQEDMLLYLPMVIPKLIEVLMNNQATTLMRAASMSAIGSAITVSELKFEPYLQNVLKLCTQFLKVPPSPEMNAIRAQNLNLLGKLANCFCKPTFSNSKAFYSIYIMPTMEYVYKMLTSETDPEIRESSFAFFYLIANAIGCEFEPVFDNIIGHILKACELVEPEKQKKPNQFSLDSDSEDEDQTQVIHQKVTEHDEKAAAIHALGELAKACPIKFIPYFPSAYKILQNHYQFWYNNVRIQVCHTYTNLTLGLVKSQNAGVIPTFIKGIPCIQRYNQQLEEYFRTELIPKIIFLMTEDQDNTVKGAAVDTLDDLVKEIGPVLVDKSLPAIKQAIIKLLETQFEEDEDDDEEPEEGEAEDDETEIQTFESICDLIPNLADILRVGFEPTLLELHPYLMKYLEVREEIIDNIQMTGCISQCVKFIPGYTTARAQELFRSLADLVKLQDTEVNRNIAYCFAEMFEKAPKVMVTHLQEGLICLKQIYQHANSELACKENAIAAICRIIYTFNPPMPLQLLIDSLIKMMPFQADQEEQPSALKVIIYLSQHNADVIKPHLQRIKEIFVNDLTNPKKYYIEEPFLSQANTFLQQLQALN